MNVDHGLNGKAKWVKFTLWSFQNYYGKSSYLMGKSTILTGPFSSSLCNTLPEGSSGYCSCVSSRASKELVDVGGPLVCVFSQIFCASKYGYTFKHGWKVREVNGGF